MTDDEDSDKITERGLGYAEGQSDLYETARGTADEWYAMKLVDDRQMLALERLLHHLDITTHYEYRHDLP